MTPYRRLQNDLFGIRRSIRYHERRRAFFEATNTWILALQVTVSSSFGAIVLLNSGTYTQLGTVVVAIVGLLAAVNLVVGSQRRASTHTALAQRFAQLEQEITPYENDGAIGDEVPDGFRQKRRAIEEGEPPKLRIVDLLCHNELVISTYQYMHFYKVGFGTRLMGHLIDMEVSEKILKSARPYEDIISDAQASRDVRTDELDVNQGSS